MNFDLQLTSRFLLSKKRGRFFSAAVLVAASGMAFGVAALLITLSVISGFQREYKKGILGVNSHLIVMNAEEMASPEETVRRMHDVVGRAEEMVGWTGFLYREGMAVSSSRVKGIVLKGVDFGRYAALSHLKLIPEEGNNPENLPRLFLGKKLAEELKPKDRTLRVLLPSEAQAEKITAKNIKRFFVAGTFEAGLYEYDSTFALIDLEEAKAFFETGGRVSGVEVWLNDPDHAGTWGKVLREKFEYPYLIMTWRELNENIFRAVEMEKGIFFLLMTVLIAIASLNVLGSLLMLILLRRTEIALLRVIGLSWRRLRRVFLLDGLFIGLTGTLGGIFLGGGVLFVLKHWSFVALAPEVYFVDRVPVDFAWSHLLWVVSVSFLLVLIGCEMALRGLSRVNVSRVLSEG